MNEREQKSRISWKIIEQRERAMRLVWKVTVQDANPDAINEEYENRNLSLSESGKANSSQNLIPDES